MAATVRFDTARLIRKVKDRAADQLDAAARFLRDKVQDNISLEGPPHSTPGEFPRYISGELQASLQYDVDRDAMTARVFATAPHAAIVEEMRPYLSRTLEENREEVTAILTDWEI